MNENTFQCAKCGGRMIKGLNVDFNRERNFFEYYPAFWIEGEPVNDLSIFGCKVEPSNLVGKR